MENTQKKVSQKKQSKAEWKWLKVIFGKLDDLEARIKRIEKQLGIKNE